MVQFIHNSFPLRNFYDIDVLSLSVSSVSVAECRICLLIIKATLIAKRQTNTQSRHTSFVFIPYHLAFLLSLPFRTYQSYCVVLNVFRFS